MHLFGTKPYFLKVRETAIGGLIKQEAEHYSLADTAAKIIWTQTLLKELKVAVSTPIIYCDNLSTVSLWHTPVLHSRTKHMELDLFCHSKGYQQELDSGSCSSS